MAFRTVACGAALASLLTAALAWSETSRNPDEEIRPDPNYAFPDDITQRAATLAREAEAIAVRYRAAQRLFRDPSLQDLTPLGQQHPNAIEKQFGPHLSVAADPLSISAWQQLQKFLAEREDAVGAAAAAWRTHQLAVQLGVEPSVRADAMFSFADTMTAAGRPRDARNAAAIAYRAEPTEARRTQYLAVAEKTRFRIISLDVDLERSIPSACIHLSEPLLARQPIPLADLLEITPSADVQPRIDADRLCIDGLRHGLSYSVTLHAGLTSTLGSRLTVPLEQSVHVGDRSAQVLFAQSAYVLPRAPAAILPVRTINRTEVPLTLYHVNDRNLVQSVLTGPLGENLAGWERERLEDSIGSKVWQGVLEVTGESNRETITNIPLDDILAERTPGIYALTSPPEKEWHSGATQWLVVSNLALTAFEALDGVHVFVRGLDDAKPRGATEVALLARNNKVLATLRTDRAGYVRFSANASQGKGGNAPALLTVQRGEDFNFLRLTGAALDLSERGIDGRVSGGAADAYLYTDRGIYRPGETVHANVLLRDRRAIAMAGSPLRIVLTRPGGVVMLDRSDRTDDLGSLPVEIPLSAAALAGAWQLQAFLDPEGPPVGSVSFQVEDFVPPRIEVNATFATPTLSPDSTARADINARFYYGAQGADLAATAQLKIEVDPEPFPRHAAFRFGREDIDFRPQSLASTSTRTNSAGDASFEFRLPPLTDRFRPLRARMTANVFDVGGRPVTRTIAAPITLHRRYVGIAPRFDGSVAEGEAAQFRIQALAPDGSVSPGGRARVQWVREQYEYVWFSDGNRWSYRQVVLDESKGAAFVDIDTQGSATLSNSLPPGHYRVEVHDEGGTASASMRFQVGWWRSGEPSNMPDALTINVTNDTPSPGDVVEVFVEAPFAGRALVTVMGETLLDSFEIDLPKEGRSFEVQVKAHWSPGAYVLVSAFRADAATPSPLPMRAMGLHWLSIDRANRTLAVELSAPDIARPRGPLTVAVQLPGGERSRVGMTLAAVDEGVLSLTQFSSPDPAAHYFGQRLFYPDAFDIYGNLIAPQPGAFGKVRGGGDASLDNATGVTLRSTRVVALYHRNIDLDGEGRGRVDLALPDFNGRLRLMAVAYGAEKLGAAERALTVRDPVVTDLLLPRFLAPGDEATATIDVRNPGDEAIASTLTLESTGAVDVQIDPQRIELEPGGMRRITVPIRASDPGTAKFSMRTALDDGSALERSFEMQVRPAAPFVSERYEQTLAPGEQTRLGATRLLPFYADSRQLTVQLTDRLGVDVTGLANQLWSYPYGCTEQIVSQGMPKLAQADLAEANYTRAGIVRVLDRQRGDGWFGTWSALDAGHPWLTAYAYDYLTRARAHGFDVPPKSLELAERAMRSALEHGDIHAAAYAAYVLARDQRAKPADVRRFVLNRVSQLRTRIGVAHAAAALALIGEHDDARALMTRALITSRGTLAVDDFGSDLRDGAAVLHLLTELPGFEDARQRVAQALDTELSSSEGWWSTQELAWLLMAAQGLTPQSPLAVSIDGKPPATVPLSFQPTEAELERGLAIVNEGSSPLRLIGSVRGVPRLSPPAASHGYRVQRSYYDGERGGIVDPARLEQGDLVLVVLEGVSERRIANQQLLVVDLLPAGLEIENARLADSTAEQKPEFLGPISAVSHEMARDDRYVAALTVHGDRRFRLAYLARAITPGTYAHPGTQVEDMYAPRFRALGEAGSVRVLREGAVSPEAAVPATDAAVSIR